MEGGILVMRRGSGGVKFSTRYSQSHTEADSQSGKTSSSS